MADNDKLSNDEKERQTESFFSPNPCRADVTLDGKLRVRVTDKNKKKPSAEFRIPDISDYRTRDELDKVLRPHREYLRSDGYEFD